LSGGLHATAGELAASTSLAGAPAAFDVARSRRIVPLEAGLHLLASLSRRWRLLAEAGAGLYLTRFTWEALSVEHQVTRNIPGWWGGLQLGVALGSGTLFLGGRYFAGLQPLETRRVTTAIEGAVAELGFDLGFGR
jgi:hypothetical protein